jgi:hypothetical protein
VFSWAVLTTGLILLGDWLRGEAEPGSQGEHRADWRAIKTGAVAAGVLAGLFLLSVWLRH